MSTLRETFLNELADAYDAEKQIIKALPKMAKAAEHDELKSLLETHLEETKHQVERLDEIFGLLDEKPKKKKCQGMQGIIAEGEQMVKDDEGDAALICAAQKVEHYEIATYGSLAEWAKMLGEEEAAETLGEILQEEKDADEKLTEVAEQAINPEESEGEEEEEEEEEATSTRRGKK